MNKANMYIKRKWKKKKDKEKRRSKKQFEKKKKKLETFKKNKLTSFANQFYLQFHPY